MVMQEIMTHYFYWMVFNYIIWLPLGQAMGAAIGGLFSLVLTCFAIVCGIVVLLLLVGLLLKTDSMERFGT